VTCTFWDTRKFFEICFGVEDIYMDPWNIRPCILLWGVGFLW